jgi:lycopene beta-cyclase
MSNIHRCDLAIVGGGLAGGLIALALAKARPELRVMLIEGEDRIGGDHIWSFFESDIARADRWLLAPLVCHSWPAYDVAFPEHRRAIAAPYHSILSERLDRVVRARLPEQAVMTGARVAAVEPDAVLLESGAPIAAGGVIDARGPADLGLLELGWQKFLGQELLLDRSHRMEVPIVMDATVPQIDGYRFVYVLPFADNRVFIEDTYYSDTPDLDVEALTRRIARYAVAHGFGTGVVVREETGVLPVALGGDFEAYWHSGGPGIAKAGMRAALFHPTTGYSLPDAVRTAALVAGLKDYGGAALHQVLHDHAARAWADRGFYRMLDKMLFRAAEPEQRYRILQRFYRLDPRLIGRFYGARATTGDKLRILSGRPPVPIGKAIGAIMRRPK